MKNKSVLIALFMFLAVLFLTTIGNSIVGYSIFDPSTTTLKEYPYPFIKNNGYNNLYIVIPEKSTLTEKQVSQNIAKSLQSTKPLPPKIIRPSEVPRFRNNNLILIGDACTNSLIAEILKTNKCTFNLRRSQGLIKLVQGKSSTLIISGYDLKSLEKSGRVISNYNSFPLRGTELSVEGNSQNLLSLTLKQR